VQALDVSFNSFGGVDSDAGVEAMAEFLRHNKSLKHLDISYNQLDGTTHLTMLSEALSDNHTLIGIHTAGGFGGGSCCVAWCQKFVHVLSPTLPVSLCATGNAFTVDACGYLHRREDSLVKDDNAADTEGHKMAKAVQLADSFARDLPGSHDATDGETKTADVVSSDNTNTDNDNDNKDGLGSLQTARIVPMVGGVGSGALEAIAEDNEYESLAAAAVTSQPSFQDQLRAMRERVSVCVCVCVCA